MVSEPEEQEREGEMGGIPLDVVPGLARIAVGAWVRGASWGLGSAARASRRLGEAAVSGASASELIGEAREETVESLRHALGLLDADRLPDPISDAMPDQSPRAERRAAERAQSLRERGAALFDRAAEVSSGEDIHPGFDQIVDQLAPDEARILRLLISDGPQPIVYINKAAPLGIGAREVARRLSIIGREAGCLHRDVVPAYLDNLVRLGLVAIRRDPIADEQAYQVVEAQPEVLDAISSVGGGLFRGQSSRRSVHLTDFGRTFCQACFPAEHLSGEFETIEADPTEEVAPPEQDLDGAV